MQSTPAIAAAAATTTTTQPPALLDVEQQRQSLKAIQQMTQSLIDCKASLLQKTETLEYKQRLLEDIVAERQRLNKERRILLDMMQNVQRDLESITEAETSLRKENGALQQSVTRLRNEEYEPLHGQCCLVNNVIVHKSPPPSSHAYCSAGRLDRVNQLRTTNGLTRIPHVQQEVDAQMARILEERRQNWQHDGGGSPSGTNHTSHPPRSRRHR
ncbi:hypothetical protein BX666DRAFT_1888688 [Dichotomocladium elegans]|nr:hypothetical protein BX666DRAFT_1888688 [Dichotomocladium elegans]